MLKQRVMTAIVLVAGLLAGLFLLPPPGWLLLVAMVCGGAGWEWAGLSGWRDWRRPVFALVVAGACLSVGMAGGLAQAEAVPHGAIFASYVVSAMFWIVLVPNWLKHKWKIERASGALVVGLVVLVPPALALAHLRQIGPLVLLAVMVLVWVADIAAYFSGRAFGRHKLAPGISPGKTWEGAAGAVAGVLVVGFALVFQFNPAALELHSPAVIATLLVLLTGVSIEGDLFESMLKRQAGIKDSGSMLPGHGGILDRIDSLTSTLPLAGLAALWMLRT